MVIQTAPSFKVITTKNSNRTLFYFSSSIQQGLQKVNAQKHAKKQFYEKDFSLK